MPATIETSIPPVQPPQERPLIPNVLADRYASIQMLNVFSPSAKVKLERELWIAIMKSQQRLGVGIPDEAISAYEAVKDQVDLDSIRERELKLRHDEKARIEEFNARAGFEFIHLGETSRDQSDNVDQLQIKRGMEIIRDRTVAALARLGKRALENESLVFAQRTHNAPAQPSLIGKLFSDTGEEMLRAFHNLERLIDDYPLRGIKGAVGTQTDMLQLLGSQEKVDELEQDVAHSLGFKHVLGSIGQVYPRSLDSEVVTTLFQLVCSPASHALTMRLMAGRDQFTEGFKKGQVGSSAMPHKMNSRTAERITSLKRAMAGYVTMATSNAGEQWYGGDVSDSAVRRIFIPDSFFAVDGIFQGFLTILDESGFYPAVIEQEVEKYLPFLTTTRLLMKAVQNGIDREEAHKIISMHSRAMALHMRQTGSMENDLLDRLANDQKFGLTKEQLEEALSNPIGFVGSAPKQIANFVSQVEKIVSNYPEAAAYMPEEIL